MRSTVLLVVVVTGCTPAADTPPPTPDAAVDAQVNVQELTCPSTVAATVMDSSTMFIPTNTTITVGQIVKFTITAEHTVIPNTLKTTDAALNVGRGQTKCFKFNVAGTYNFLCGVHSFPGSIVVM